MVNIRLTVEDVGQQHTQVAYKDSEGIPGRCEYPGILGFPEDGRCGSELSGSEQGIPDGPVVEPGRGGASHRASASDRAGEAGLDIQIHHG